MFTRATWSKLSTSVTVEQALKNYREKILPSLQTQAGFLGAVILANPETREGVSATYWESAEAMAATEAMATAGRAQTAQEGGIEITEIDRFELLLSDRVQPATVGTFARANDAMMEPGQVDSLLAFLRDTAIPAARSLQGYRSTRVSANRQTGRVLVSTVWDTAADREASEAAMSGLRRQAAEVGRITGQVKVNLYEVVLTELTPAAQQATISAAAIA